MSMQRANVAVRELFDDYRFDIHELAQAPDTQFTAVSRVFHPTERQPRVRRNHTVEKHEAGVELVDKSGLFVRITGPGAGAQPEAGIVGQRNRGVEIRDPKESGDRAEQLFAISGRLTRDVDEYSRREE